VCEMTPYAGGCPVTHSKLLIYCPGRGMQQMVDKLWIATFRSPCC